MKKVMKTSALLTVVLFAAVAGAQSISDRNDKSANAMQSTGPTSDAGAASDYVIGADDTLHISVWKEPDLSETLPVRPDGKISMPSLRS
jgi:polysaccharide export outer membrane protein